MGAARHDDDDDDNVARYIHWQLCVNVDWKELIASMNRSQREWWKVKISKYCGTLQTSVITILLRIGRRLEKK